MWVECRGRAPGVQTGLPRAGGGCTDRATSAQHLGTGRDAEDAGQGRLGACRGAWACTKGVPGRGVKRRCVRGRVSGSAEQERESERESG